MPPSETFRDAALIAVDWGTSRLRAWLLDPRGGVLAEAASDDGIGKVADSHEAVFSRLAADWPSSTPAVMAGMIGSRQGWREVPYVACPATASQIAAGVVRFDAGDRAVAIVPGLVVRSGEGDVLRGEETQIVGLIDGEPAFSGLVILPGTHSKWVRVEAGRIVGFQSFLTGELFDLLSRTSFLRHSVKDDGRDLSRSPGFAPGVRRTAIEEQPFLATLFPVRVRQLVGSVDPGDNLAYLSGLIIGGEIAAARASGRLMPGTPIRLVGSRSLGRAYRVALDLVGFPAETRDGDELVRVGLVHLARVAGLL
jgi:2-dehydro-3-deoxygalactonokinase